MQNKNTTRVKFNPIRTQMYTNTVAKRAWESYFRSDAFIKRLAC